MDDLVRGIRLLIEVPPLDVDSLSTTHRGAWSISYMAKKNPAKGFRDAINEAVGKIAIRNHMQMQMCDVPATWANNDLLQHLTGYPPRTNLKDGFDINRGVARGSGQYTGNRSGRSGCSDRPDLCDEPRRFGGM